MRSLIPSDESVRLARSILQAWAAKDARRLQAELMRAEALSSVAARARGLESERLELLATVGFRMRRSEDPFEARVCVDLLRNLVMSDS
jgi:hypothetical protein